MSRRDVLHSGYADTAAPLTNNTLWITSLNEITTSSPAIVNGILYIGTGNGTIYALDTVDGSIIWDYVTGGAVKSSPAVVDGVVYVASDDQYLYALDADDGSYIWSYNVGGSSYNTSPTVVDGTVYFGASNKVFSINATDGSLNWEKTLEGSYFLGSSPTVVDGVVCFGMYESRRVFLLNATDGSEIWNYYTWSHVCSSPTIVDGVIYIGNNEGRLYALNVTATGDPYLWDVHLGGSSAQFSSSPAYCNGVIYIGDTEGTMYARNATDGSEIWTTPAGVFLFSSAAVADGVAYIGSNDENMYAFNATDGTLLWTYTTDGAIWSSPAIVDGTVYVASGDGKVYAFNTQTSTVTFNETGLPSGTSWTVTLDGITKTSNDNSIEFTDIAYGTYDYTINTPTGYIASVTSGSITVNGADTQQTVTYAAIPYNWWMLGNGVTHTGYSNSTGPLTNDLLWSKSIADLGMDLSGCATPVVADGVLYLKLSGTIFALDAYNSTLIRSYDLGSSYYCPQSPAVVDGVLYAGTGAGEVLAFNTTTGDIIWTFTADGGILSSPTIENGVLYIGANDNNVYAINATTGDQLWAYQTNERIYSSPAVSNGIVVVGSNNGILYALDAHTGSQVWNYSTSYSANNEAPCIVDGVVYAGQYYSSDGNFSALNLTTGAKIWSISKSVWGSVAFANSILYINSNADGYTYAINATTGAQLWSYNTLARYLSPIVAYDVVYVQGSTDLYALNSTNGDLIWSYPLFSMMPGSSSPIIADGIVYAFNDDGMGGPMTSGTIYAFGVPNQYTLTMNTVGHGTVIPGNQTSVDAGTTLNLVAIPDEGWVFSGWSGDASGSTNTTITMTSNKTVTATFTEVISVNLTMLTAGQGSVTPGNETYTLGTSVDLKAIPAAGWSFSGWTGDASGIENTTITMTGNKTVTATFTQDTYYLTMITVGNGSVNPGNNSYASGTTIDIEAINEVGWTFDGWSGAAEGLSNTTITMNANKTVTATFAQNNYRLTMITIGTGSVTPGNQTTYHYGDNVDIAAISTTPYVFSGWSGSTSGNTNKTITITGNMTVTATFVINSHTVYVNQGSHGTITPGTATVNDGGSQTFTIYPDTGYHIVDVIVDSSSVGAVTSYQFTNMQEDHIITATFAANEYTLTITTIGNGSVTATPATATYHYGDIVQLNAIPNNGWSFNGWSGDTQGTTNTTITIDGNKNIIANFTQNSYQISFTLTGVDSTGVVLTVDGVGYTVADLPQTFNWLYGSVHTFVFNSTLPVSNDERYVWNITGGLSTLKEGTLTVTGAGTIAGAYTTQYLLTVATSKGSTSGSGWYNSGTSATAAVSQSTVTLGTDTRYIFDGWSGDASGTQESISVTMDEPKTVTANWETQYRVTVTANPANGGATTPSTATWMPAGTLDISCTPNADYLFTSWSKLDCTNNPNFTIVSFNNCHKSMDLAQ